MPKNTGQIRDAINDAMCRQNWSLQDLATRSNVPISTLSRIVNARVRSIKPHTWHKLMPYLKATGPLDDVLFIPHAIVQASKDVEYLGCLEEDESSGYKVIIPELPTREGEIVAVRVAGKVVECRLFQVAIAIPREAAGEALHPMAGCCLNGGTSNPGDN